MHTTRQGSNSEQVFVQYKKANKIGAIWLPNNEICDITTDPLKFNGTAYVHHEKVSLDT